MILWLGQLSFLEDIGDMIGAIVGLFVLGAVVVLVIGLINAIYAVFSRAMRLPTRSDKEEKRRAATETPYLKFRSCVACPPPDAAGAH